MIGWGSKGHTSQGDRQYDPGSASWDYAPVREHSDGTQQHASFFTEAGKAIFTNAAVQTTPSGVGSGVGHSSASTAGGGGTTGAGVQTVVSPGRSSSGLSPWTGDKKLKTALKPENTSVLYMGYELELPPGYSNADQWEEMLGEDFGGLVGGILNFGPFIGHNARRATNQMLTESGKRGPGNGGGGAELIGKWWEEANSPFGPDKPVWGFDGGGF